MIFLAVGSHALPTQVLRTCTDGMFVCFARWAHNVTGGLFWTLMLLGFAFAMFMATVRLGNVRAFGFGSFVGMIGAIFLATLQLMPWWTASAFILSGVVGIAMMVMNSR